MADDKLPQTVDRRAVFTAVLVPAGAAALDGGAASANAPQSAGASDLISLAGKADRNANLTDLSDLERARNALGFFSARAAAIAAAIPAVVTTIHLSGYASPHDGGGQDMTRAEREPPHAGKLRSRDGQWWELAEDRPNVLQFGADNRDNAQSDSAQAFADALAFKPGVAVYVPAGLYYCGQIDRLGQAGAAFYGAGRFSSIIRPAKALGNGEAIFCHRNQTSGVRPGSSAFGFIRDIGIDLGGRNCGAVDLSSCTSFELSNLWVRGGTNLASSTGYGIKFAAPLEYGAYTNSVRDCSLHFLERGVWFDTGGNANNLWGGECIGCSIGIDAAPPGKVDRIRVIGTRIEGCATGIKERSDRAFYYAVGFEENRLDMDFLSGSNRPTVIGAYTAASGQAVRGLEKAVSPVILSPDLGVVVSETSISRPIRTEGASIFTAPGAGFDWNPPHVGYSAAFGGMALLGNNAALEGENAAGDSSVIGLRINAADELEILGFARKSEQYGPINIGAGPAVRPMTPGKTALGDATRPWGGGHIYGTVNRTAAVVDAVGTGSPEGRVAGAVGSTYRRTDGGAGTSFYVKEGGTGNRGWVAK